MKKFFIILIILIVIVVGCVAFQSETEPEDLNINQTVEEEPKLKPWEVTVGLYNPDAEQNKLTTLLESRLKELGFKVEILTELVDPDAAKNEKTTLLFRMNTKKELEVVIDKVMGGATSFRKGENNAILQDVIISVWNIDDISWGSFSELANKYNTPEPAEISVTVVNAGAESGAAGEIAELLEAEGFPEVEAKNAKEGEETTEPSLVYYQRNYKTVARNMRKFLIDHGYANTTYRARLEQETNIVIILGPKDSQEELEPEPPTPTIIIEE